MNPTLNDSKPLFLQIKKQLEDSILKEAVKAGERVPSTNEFAAFYNINPATAAKGINELVAEGILFKRRGVGMFVTDEAKKILIMKRKQTFYENFVQPLKKEAEKLGIAESELRDMLKEEVFVNED